MVNKLDVYKKVKCMLKKIKVNWCQVSVNFLFVSLLALLFTFFNLKRAQASDKNWSGSTFQPLLYIIWLVDIQNVLKVLNIKHFLVLNVGRSFSLICSLHCHIISIVNDKTCLRTLSPEGKCVEAMGKSSFIKNSS